MDNDNHIPTPDSQFDRRQRRNVYVVATIVVLVGWTLGAILWIALGVHGFWISSDPRIPSSVPIGPFPTGVASVNAPSGMSPPEVDSMVGYLRKYVSNFDGSALPTGWFAFTGVPGGDPGGQFGSSHVVVGGGLLQLNTWRDPMYGNKWVTGGVCQCGLKRTYGAYFVRSRITGAGPNEAEVLWPASNIWPPEIDFNETGTSDSHTSATVHFGAANNIDQRHLQIDMKQWHTWGVIWSANFIVYTVDGHQWGQIVVASEIPNVPMTLDFEQRSSCKPIRDCPTMPVSMQVDWVAEFAPK